MKLLLSRELMWERVRFPAVLFNGKESREEEHRVRCAGWYDLKGYRFESVHWDATRRL